MTSPMRTSFPYGVVCHSVSPLLLDYIASCCCIHLPRLLHTHPTKKSFTYQLINTFFLFIYNKLRLLNVHPVGQISTFGSTHDTYNDFEITNNKQQIAKSNRTKEDNSNTLA